MKRLLAALSLVILPLAPALAQGPIRAQQQQPGVIPPPPALPGLAGRPQSAPIPAEPNVVLAPNAALFDAISRGDLAAARDAVGRGANLNGRNALGLTPLDAAVDQGRNDIAFFLLSARETGRAPPPAAPSSLGGPPPAAPAAPSQGGAALLRRDAAPRPQPAAAPAAPATARLWAGDGGAPRPEIGFLGFDAGRPAGGRPGG